MSYHCRLAVVGTLAILTLMVAIPCVAGAEKEPPPEVVKYLERCEAYRKERISGLTAFLAETRRAKSPPREKAASIKKLTAQLKEVKTAPIVPAFLPDFPKDGDMGTFNSPGQYVVQVIDEKNCIVKLSAVISGGVSPQGQPRYKTAHYEVWIRGVDTSKMADDRGTELPQIFIAKGNQKYDTVIGGQRTLQVVEVIDLSPWIPKPPTKGLSEQ